MAREPGHRSKIAVASNEPAVDPVGACVGPKGSRVRMVVNELRGEKIDVVPWSDESAKFVANALQPAKVEEVTVNPETQTALVIVPDYQLSLAIGREGQNARLAARLTGWRIDIKSESQAAEPAPRRPRAPPPPVEEALRRAEEAAASRPGVRGSGGRPGGDGGGGGHRRRGRAHARGSNARRGRAGRTGARDGSGGGRARGGAGGRMIGHGRGAAGALVRRMSGTRAEG